MPLYAHSRCCNAHWELVCTDEGKPELHCEKCGEDIGDLVKIEFTGPIPDHCDCCEKEKCEKEVKVKKKNDKRRADRKISKH